MKGKLRARISTADSPKPIFKHKVTLSERIIEQDGKKFRVEILGGKEFNLPLDKRERVSWKSMTPQERIAYAIAYCKHNNCGISDLPGALSHVFYSSQEEMKQVLEGIGRPTEKIEFLNGKEFKLPLDGDRGISWKSMTPNERVAYAIALCLENNCEIKSLPWGLFVVIRSNPEEMQQFLEGIGRPTKRVEILNRTKFTLPLDTRGFVSWKSMTPEDRIVYSIAHMLHHGCRLEGLPSGLYGALSRNPIEKQKVLERIGILSVKNEKLNEQEFVLKLNTEGNVSWGTMSPDERVAYAIAFCLQNKCGIGKLPVGLKEILRANPLEKRRVLDTIGRKSEEIQVLNGKEFVLPLDSRGMVTWGKMLAEERIAYAIAYSTHFKCSFRKLPAGLRNILNRKVDEKTSILEVLGRKSEEIQVLNGVTFTLPLDSRGFVFWGSLSPEERISYATAFLKHHKCGLAKLPGGLRQFLSSNPSEKQKVLEALGKKFEKIEVLDGQTFILPLNAEENISWKSMVLNERIRYAIAYCKHNKCGIGKLPIGLKLNLTSAQRAQIMQELSKSKESDQLDKLANAMEEFQ